MTPAETKRLRADLLERLPEWGKAVRLAPGNQWASTSVNLRLSFLEWLKATDPTLTDEIYSVVHLPKFVVAFKEAYPRIKRYNRRSRGLVFMTSYQIHPTDPPVRHLCTCQQCGDTHVTYKPGPTVEELNTALKLKKQSDSDAA